MATSNQQEQDGKKAYNAIRKYYGKLCDAIEGSLVTVVANKCNESGIINSATKRSITSRRTSQDDYERASELVGKVQTTVKLNPAKFEGFMIILLEVEIDPTLVTSISNEYGKHLPRVVAYQSMHKQEQDMNSPPHSLKEDNREDSSIEHEMAKEFQSITSPAIDMPPLSLMSDDGSKRLTDKLRRNFSKLVEAIELANVIKVATKCNEIGLIATAAKNTITSRNTRQDDYERASDLMEKVLASIRLNPSKIEDFLIVLVEAEVDSNLIIDIAKNCKVEFPGSDRKPLPKFFEHIKEMDQFSSLLAGASNDVSVSPEESNREDSVLDGSNTTGSLDPPTDDTYAQAKLKESNGKESRTAAVDQNGGIDTSLVINDAKMENANSDQDKQTDRNNTERTLDPPAASYTKLDSEESSSKERSIVGQNGGIVPIVASHVNDVKLEDKRENGITDKNEQTDGNNTGRILDPLANDAEVEENSREDGILDEADKQNYGNGNNIGGRLNPVAGASSDEERNNGDEIPDEKKQNNGNKKCNLV